LLQHKTITSWEAIRLFKLTRLAAIIFKLRNKRNKVVWDIRTDKMEYKGQRYAKYVLVTLPNSELSVNTQPQKKEKK